MNLEEAKPLIAELKVAFTDRCREELACWEEGRHHAGIAAEHSIGQQRDCLILHLFDLKGDYGISSCEFLDKFAGPDELRSWVKSQANETIDRVNRDGFPTNCGPYERT
jgi:hypothetical protein